MKLSIGFSPCPNDTFIFDALVHGRIPQTDFDFEVILADVEELNRLAFKGKLDITKISYHAYAYIAEKYQLLNAGSALGNNCGPLLIAKRPLTDEEIKQGPIAIPGKYTTANFLMGLAYPEAQNKKEILFSEIEEAVLRDEVAAGVIIHENRFTYELKGLKKIIDLGEHWESTTQHPIPLGGISIKRSTPLQLKLQFNQLLKDSIAYAFKNPDESFPYIQQHAQEMEVEVMKKHIDLYVNDYSLDLGEKGRAAVVQMYQKGIQHSLIPKLPEDIFIK